MCTFYKPPQSKRNYSDVPSFTTAEMDMNQHLQSCSLVIESAIAELDARSNYEIKDVVPIRIYELLLDQYHFKDEAIGVDSGAEEYGYKTVNDAIKNNRILFDYETLVKVIAVLRLVARRRTRGGREYLKVVQVYAGVLAGTTF